MLSVLLLLTLYVETDLSINGGKSVTVITEYPLILIVELHDSQASVRSSVMVEWYGETMGTIVYDVVQVAPHQIVTIVVLMLRREYGMLLMMTVVRVRLLLLAVLDVVNDDLVILVLLLEQIKIDLAVMESVFLGISPMVTVVLRQ
jgi:hypothetical protein